MRESVLLINFKDKKKLREIQMMVMTLKLREIQMMVMTLKLRMRLIEKTEYMNPIGYLAGMKDMEAGTESYAGEELEKEMMVFAGLTEAHLDQMLYLMKKSGIVPVDYKAVLTETNKSWTVPELYEELEREHLEMMKRK